MIADYELRGTAVDTERVYNVMKDRLAAYLDNQTF